ncbi:posphoenolpyruvate synthetase regulatory kinase/phosphorylase PpsR [Oceanospirillum beijerinckii]|uniref:posphoenolpyruvate synthetase regulatory kinase/phosphorylase PpsR n=1 Tax=Oceanospirillum beijerinckii TaxID=64976 RepID=UPI0004013397|nr:pyruvate, water dikinase regulatory protein [Oceanospirillum beijerinckii]MAC46601.1 kinase/pyrophosphorylase [Oceanospirillum sp.]
MKRTAFFISDGTGITVEALGRSLLGQFEHTEFVYVIKPFVDTVEKAERLVAQINEVANLDGIRPVVVDTIVDKKVREALRNANAFTLDIFSTFLAPLEEELGSASSYSVGKSHSIKEDDKVYKDRIDSVHYAIDNDDGGRTRHYDKADIILIGPSRSGKTPTCLYMALQFGIRAANYPLTEEDFEYGELPKALKQHKHKLYGLTIDPMRLAAIRNERKPDSRYASMKQCDQEVAEAELLYQRYGIPYINTTHFSIEEISTRMMDEAGIERRAAPK